MSAKDFEKIPEIGNPVDYGYPDEYGGISYDYYKDLESTKHPDQDDAITEAESAREATEKNHDHIPRGRPPIDRRGAVPSDRARTGESGPEAPRLSHSGNRQVGSVAVARLQPTEVTERQQPVDQQPELSELHIKLVDAVQNIHDAVRNKDYKLQPSSIDALTGKHPTSRAMLAATIVAIDTIRQDQVSAADAVAGNRREVAVIDRSRPLAQQIQDNPDSLLSLVEELETGEASGVRKLVMEVEMDKYLDMVKKFQDKKQGEADLRQLICKRQPGEADKVPGTFLKGNKDTRFLPPYEGSSKYLDNCMLHLRDAGKRNSYASEVAGKDFEYILEHRIGGLDDEWQRSEKGAEARESGEFLSPWTLQRCIALGAFFAASYRSNAKEVGEKYKRTMEEHEKQQKKDEEADIDSVPHYDTSESPDNSILLGIAFATNVAKANFENYTKELRRSGKLPDGRMPDVPQSIRDLEALSIRFHMRVLKQVNQNTEVMETILEKIKELGTDMSRTADIASDDATEVELLAAKNPRVISDAAIMYVAETAAAIRILGANSDIYPELVTKKANDLITHLLRQLQATDHRPNRQAAGGQRFGITDRILDTMTEDDIREELAKIGKDQWEEGKKVGISPSDLDFKTQYKLNLLSRVAQWVENPQVMETNRNKALGEINKEVEEQTNPPAKRIYIMAGPKSNAAFLSMLIAELGGGTVNQCIIEGKDLHPQVHAFVADHAKSVSQHDTGTSYPRYLGFNDRESKNRVNLILGKTPTSLKAHELLETTAANGASLYQLLEINKEFHINLIGLLSKGNEFYNKFTAVELQAGEDYDVTFTADPHSHQLHPNAGVVILFRNNDDGSKSTMYRNFLDATLRRP